jgi:hypothetical protein
MALSGIPDYTALTKEVRCAACTYALAFGWNLILTNLTGKKTLDRGLLIWNKFPSIIAAGGNVAS